MNSIKAITAGIVFIIVATLLMQLAYLFIAVSYNSLAKSYPYLNEISGIFRYLTTISVFIMIMFAGGYLTAMIVETRVLIHSFIVGFITTAGMMWMALENANFTTTGIIINSLMLIATTLGGFYWSKRNIIHSIKTAQ